MNCGRCGNELERDHPLDGVVHEVDVVGDCCLTDTDWVVDV